MNYDSASSISQETPDFTILFNHSRLDDYGLSASQFRVYAHLARRAGRDSAWPAIKTIARVCSLHPQTVRRAIATLLRHRLIERSFRPGRTPLYTITKASRWQPPTHITGHSCEADTTPSDSESATSKPMHGYPSETKTAEGNPIEGDPTKEIKLPHNPPPGESERGKLASSPSKEEVIYDAYPRKVGKPAALRAIRRAISRHGFEVVLERTRLYASTYNGDPDFMPNPSKFFCEDRFMDDPATWRRISPASTKANLSPPRKFDSGDYQQPSDKF